MPCRSARAAKSGLGSAWWSASGTWRDLLRRSRMLGVVVGCTAAFWGCGGGGGTAVPGAPPSQALAYDENPATYAVGRPILVNRPSWPNSAGVSFEMPNGPPPGLELDSATGAIRGVPAGPLGSATYRVNRLEGSAVAGVDLAITVASPLVLVDTATAEAPVYWWGGDEERAAAAMLASYLGRISGRSGFAATPGPTQTPARGFVVGPAPFAGFELPLSSSADEFVVRTRGECIQLTGQTPRSTHYAVSTYLERCLGCRFWALAVPVTGAWEEDIPSAFPLVSPRPNLRVRPALEQRDAGYLESRESAYGQRRMTSGVRFTASHNMHQLLESPDYNAYAANHPEIYPCAEPGPGTLAERKRNNLHLCYTDPGLPQALADALSVDVKNQGRDLKNWIYFAGQGDWYGGHCLCDRCQAVYEQETWIAPSGDPQVGYSGTLVRMMNRVAELLDRRFPGIKVGTFAYMGTEAPCGLTRPRSNLAIRVPHLRHCIVHAVDECVKNSRYWGNLNGWLAHDQGGGVYVWDYSQVFPDGFLYSAPNVYSIARSLQQYGRLGVRGAYTQGCNVSPGGDLAAMKMWLYSQLMVDPRLDVDELLEEFCSGYYGPAGDHILAYVRAMRDSVYDPSPIHHHNEFARIDEMRSKWLTPALIAQLHVHRDAALAAVGQDPDRRRRVLEATVALRAYEIYVPTLGSGTGVGWTGPLSEGTHNGQTVLIRDNIGRYTYDETVEMVNNCRLTSPYEWGNGFKAREIQLAAQGGPLIVLSQGDLTAKFAPAIKGQLRQLTFRGADCLHVATTQDGYPVYPVAASSHQDFTPLVHTWRLVGVPSTTMADVEAYVGIGNWGGNDLDGLVHTIARNTYTVADPGAGSASLVIEGTVQATPGSGKPWLRATVETVYAVTDDPTAHSVTADLDNGVVTVRLPGQTWSIRDAYSGNKATAITTTHNPVLKTLTVLVTLAETTATKEAPTEYIRRTISFLTP